MKTAGSFTSSNNLNNTVSGTKEIQEYFMKHNFQSMLEKALGECYKNKPENPYVFLVPFF
jgi:hypothetical protein